MKPQAIGNGPLETVVSHVAAHAVQPLDPRKTTQGSAQPAAAQPTVPAAASAASTLAPPPPLPTGVVAPPPPIPAPMVHAAQAAAPPPPLPPVAPATPATATPADEGGMMRLVDTMISCMPATRAPVPLADVALDFQRRKDHAPEVQIPAPPLPAQEPASATPSMTRVQARVQQALGISIPTAVALEALPEEESLVDVDAVLAQVPGLPGMGSSRGGLSSHMLQDFQRCERMSFYSLVQGRVQRTTPVHFALGTLVHAMLAMRYAGMSERQYEPADRVSDAGAPDIAQMAKALVRGLHTYRGEEEANTWCPRAVEENLVFHLPPAKINGKQVRIPISGRTDLLLALRAGPKAPVPGLGVVDSGIWLVDHKTPGYISWDLIKGFTQEFQFLVYTIGYMMGGLEAKHGPLNGFMVNILGKAGTTIKDKSRIKLKPEQFVHERLAWSKPQVAEFYLDQLVPLATRLYQKITDPMREDPRNWPRSNSACVGRYGPCPYFNLCLGDHADLYTKVDEARIVRPENFKPYKKADDPLDAPGIILPYFLPARQDAQAAKSKKLQDQEVRAAVAQEMVEALTDAMFFAADAAVWEDFRLAHAKQSVTRKGAEAAAADKLADAVTMQVCRTASEQGQAPADACKHRKPRKETEEERAELQEADTLLSLWHLPAPGTGVELEIECKPAWDHKTLRVKGFIWCCEIPGIGRKTGTASFKKMVASLTQRYWWNPEWKPARATGVEA